MGLRATPRTEVRPPGLDRNSFPMRLWKKAKSLGVWDPEAIDFSEDREQWPRIDSGRRERILQIGVLFQAGEEAVTRNFLPLITVVSDEGRREEELFLTSFLWEEAKHVDLFNRFLDEVVGEQGDLSGYRHPGYGRLIDEELRNALTRLAIDRSPAAQVAASVTFHIVTEGVLAEAGYYLMERSLAGSGLLPGLQHAISLVQRDESRHIAFGLYFISRLIVEHGDVAYKAFLDRMIELKPLVEQSTREFFDLIRQDDLFGALREEVKLFSERRFATRVQHIIKARTLRMEELGSEARFKDAIAMGETLVIKCGRRD